MSEIIREDGEVKSPFSRLRDVVQRERELREEKQATVEDFKHFVEENRGKVFKVSGIAHTRGFRVDNEDGRSHWNYVPTQPLVGGTKPQVFEPAELILLSMEKSDFHLGSSVELGFKGVDNQVLIIGIESLVLFEPVSIPEPIQS